MSTRYSYFLMTSCFFCSSDVGSPSSFCLWSYIIFSTRPLVSPSRSESLLGSGFTFFVLISGSLVITCAHHCILFTCNRQTSISSPILYGILRSLRYHYITNIDLIIKLRLFNIYKIIPLLIASRFCPLWTYISTFSTFIEKLDYFDIISLQYTIVMYVADQVYCFMFHKVLDKDYNKRNHEMFIW